MWNKVRQYIADRQLLDHNKRYLVALSGGADSVALLRIVLRLGYDVEAAHCNFHLRGEEANRDQRFVEDLCDRLGVMLHIAHFNTKEYAEERKISIEMAARDLRYAYFSQLVTSREMAGVLVAHHKDDSAETILMNMIRGTGVNGLTGIKPVSELAIQQPTTEFKIQNSKLIIHQQPTTNDQQPTTNDPQPTASKPQNRKTAKPQDRITILRPLLCLTRADIIRYIEDEHQDYITDSSNLEADVVRNKIRLNILPLLKEITPSAVENILRTAANLADANENSDEHQLFTILKPYGFNGVQVRRIAENMDTATGKQYHSKSHSLLIDRGTLMISENSQAQSPETPASVSSPETPASVMLSALPALTSTTFDLTDRHSAYLDADKVKQPLTLRTVKTGDRFVPFGMTGSKLISDYLTDIKMPLTEKQQQKVMTDADGNIVWLVDLRTDNRYAITNKTKKILIIKSQ